MNSKKPEALTDEELEAVSGGLYAGDGRMIVTVGYCCRLYQCKEHDSSFGSSFGNHAGKRAGGWVCEQMGERHAANCGNCRCCVYERGLWLCNDHFNLKG